MPVIVPSTPDQVVCAKEVICAFVQAIGNAFRVLGSGILRNRRDLCVLQENQRETNNALLETRKALVKEISTRSYHDQRLMRKIYDLKRDLKFTRILAGSSLALASGSWLMILIEHAGHAH